MITRFHPGRLLAIVSAVLLIIASFLPWAKISMFGISKTVLGIQGDGKIQVGIAVIVLVLLAMPKIKTWIPMIFVIVAGLVAAVDYSNIAQANRDLETSEFAFGFYLILLSIIGLLSGCIWAMFTPKTVNAQQPVVTEIPLAD